MNALLQFSFGVTAGTLPTTAVLTANPMSGPVGTNFAFSAGGLTPLTMYDVRFISAPAGNQSNAIIGVLMANALGQLPFGFDTGVNGVVGTYVLGIALRGTATILAQTTVVVTVVAGQGRPSTGSVPAIVTGPTVTIGS